MSEGVKANIVAVHAMLVQDTVLCVYLGRGSFGAATLTIVVTTISLRAVRLTGTIHIVDTSNSLPPTRISRPLNIGNRG